MKQELSMTTEDYEEIMEILMASTAIVQDKQINKHTNKHTHTTNTQTNKQTNKQTNRARASKLCL